MSAYEFKDMASMNNDVAGFRPERERDNSRGIFDTINKAAVLHQN